MEGWLAALEGASLAQALRAARWGYAGVSATHILGIAILVGAILPLNLRLLGLWPNTDRETLIAVLVPVAMVGAVIALTTGALLFSIRATEYANLSVVWVKGALIAAGLISALVLHARHGLHLRRASTSTLKAHAGISIGCWLAALVSGRLIAFAG